MADEGTFWIDEEKGYLVFGYGEKKDKFVIEDEITVDKQKYLILIPADLLEDENEEVVIMKVEKDGEQEVLSVIDDDEEFARVKEAYISLLD